MSKADYLLFEARELRHQVKSWGDFSHAMFNQQDGWMNVIFPDEEERKEFYHSEQYTKIHEILIQLMTKFGVQKGGLRIAKAHRDTIVINRFLEVYDPYESLKITKEEVAEKIGSVVPYEKFEDWFQHVRTSDEQIARIKFLLLNPRFADVPIDIDGYWGETPIIMDGCHRLIAAILNKRETIDCYYHGPAETLHYLKGRIVI